jgi:hypothetical protein
LRISLPVKVGVTMLKNHSIRSKSFIAFLVLFAGFSNIQAQEISVGIEGDYYSPAISSGCYVEQRVIRISNTDIVLVENGKKILWIDKIRTKIDGHRVTIEGVPVGNALVNRAFKLMKLEYDFSPEILTPTRVRFDESEVDLKDPLHANSVLTFTLVPCKKPAFLGRLAIASGWYSAYSDNVALNVTAN